MQLSLMIRLVGKVSRSLGSLRTASNLSKPSSWYISRAGIENLFQSSGSVPIIRNFLQTRIKLLRSQQGRKRKILSRSSLGRIARFGSNRDFPLPSKLSSVSKQCPAGPALLVTGSVIFSTLEEFFISTQLPLTLADKKK